MTGKVDPTNSYSHLMVELSVLVGQTLWYTRVKPPSLNFIWDHGVCCNFFRCFSIQVTILIRQDRSAKIIDYTSVNKSAIFHETLYEPNLYRVAENSVKIGQLIKKM